MDNKTKWLFACAAKKAGSKIKIQLNNGKILIGRVSLIMDDQFLILKRRRLFLPDTLLLNFDQINFMRAK